MQAVMIALSLHVLAAVFWAGSTFALARTAGTGSERLFGPQLGAAAIAILTGGYLWRTLHEGSFGTMEQVLGVGVLSALIALAVQIVVVGGALRKLRRQEEDDKAGQRSRIATAHRVAALLLAVATLSMAAARYA